MSADKVIVYSFPRASAIPSQSPFVLKLETFLRMADIQYQCDHRSKFSKKGKIPWIHCQGDAVADSSFCVEYLQKKFNRFLDADLSEEEKGISRAFMKMMEENTIWATIVQGRIVENFPWFLQAIHVPKALHFLLKLTLRRKITGYMWSHGIGRHSNEEIHSIGETDLHACSQLLGKKPYFMGDQATVIDATMFGFLAQLLYDMPDHHWTTELLVNKYPNLSQFCDRMKNKYWPDWDELLVKGKGGSSKSDGNENNL
ncbi:uncharacterized protein TRIADDRAFT_59245 [Trichoplax adhaerens]|uniref:GST C-terminal domain-containing protein n=1 Tax=Trichoplax adhaerens TaxID=10228 RepID=B3S595_TRIAD|nr:hypothetical protein TRIADDRAFT_59245 [Trichoplax adhaerens]EDV22224.1 hypothetical protein TRIADDRAFT_59245 [Trichoplax adhaerens]|eukprot:XP_002115379.1 hypothetical protein TRIADDRAFT_59245 [Trichoplax adhaerens]